MKKLLSAILASVLMFGCLTLGFGCKKKTDIVDDPKTINVRLYKAGFGDLFIYELKQKFEKVFAKEGYKVNILKPSSSSAGTPMVQEMSRGYKKTKIDLYVTGAIWPNHVSKDGLYGEVCEDLEELVFNKTAIDYSGKESEKKISQLMNPDLVPFLLADDGTMYGFSWAQTSAGMVVNTSKLADYGITELPRTTNEMFECFEMIKNGANGLGPSSETKTYPVTYNLAEGAGGATTYQNSAFKQWIAQYDIDWYNEHLRMQTENADGTWTDMQNGWQIFQDERIVDVLEVGIKFMAEKYAAPNSTVHDLDQAQGLIMAENDGRGNNAVFMLNGDWFLNEIKANYKNQLHDIGFMNVPVISAFGVKLMGAGTRLNLSDDKCDEVLSYACKLVDEGKTVDEIIAGVTAEQGVTLNKEEAQAIATARGICFSRGIEHLAFITKGSTKAEIASLFLRMMASADYANTFLSKANGSTPYATSTVEPEYEFISQARALVSNPHFRAINGRVQGVRREVLTHDYMLPIAGASNIALVLRGKTGDPRTEATSLQEEAVATAKRYWDDYFSK
ncbi:MAG: carbohydrate ABC transporter substrate-binding protein [Clostridia bacterium]|nr:carbohydrate ABC transporter substrate-binding protein [Clostridia bacterium]